MCRECRIASGKPCRSAAEGPRPEASPFRRPSPRGARSGIALATDLLSVAWLPWLARFRR